MLGPPDFSAPFERVVFDALDRHGPVGLLAGGLFVVLLLKHRWDLETRKTQLDELREVVSMVSEIRTLSETTKRECSQIRDSLKVGPLRPSDLEAPPSSEGGEKPRDA
jgi:hypothetical protein